MVRHIIALGFIAATISACFVTVDGPDPVGDECDGECAMSRSKWFCVEKCRERKESQDSAKSTATED